MDGNEVAGPLGCAFADMDYVTRRIFELADEEAQRAKIARQAEIAEQHKISDERSRLDVFHNRLSHFEDVIETRLRAIPEFSETERQEHLAGLANLMAEMRKHPENCKWF